MGDPKFSRRKYDTPSHPWRAERIKTETELQKRFGLKNKREIWKAQSLVRTFRAQSRDLQARLRTGSHQAEVESKQLLAKCARMGLLPEEGTTLNDVLAINIENVLTRRFQTMVFQRGLAYTADQARQFITHGHVSIKGRVITIPGYLVKRGEENDIAYAAASPIANELHPMRPKPKDVIELEKQKVAIEEAQKEAAKEKPKPPVKKEAIPEAKVPKAIKPSLEKLLVKEEAAEEKDIPLPDVEDEAPAEEKKPVEAKKPAEEKAHHPKKEPHHKKKDKEKEK